MLRWPDEAEVVAALASWAQQIRRDMPGVRAIGYFGSYARGDWGPGSDLDVVIVSDVVDPDPFSRAARFDTTTLPVPVDLLIYTPAELARLRTDATGLGPILRTECCWLSDPFHAFEHEGWLRVPRSYDEAFGPLTAGAAGPLLGAAGVGPGTRVLDVATGPGHVAAQAAARGAVPVGIDFSAAMVEQARRQHPAVEFMEGNAEALEFRDASFDAVVMNFGLLHLGHPELALAEAHRVLRPGGRFAFTVWQTPEHAVGFGIILDAVSAHGTLDVELPAGPPFFRFSDPAESERALTAAGFTSPRHASLPLVWRLPSPEALFETMLVATVRTAGLLRAQSPPALAAIRAAVATAAARHAVADGIEVPMPALLMSAARPDAA